MSTNLATILVGLGYDLSALEKGAPEAFRLVNQQTLGMSAEMKRNSREGAESLRLIDEALGVHISRPLTRIIGQTSLLGPALAGVLGASAGIAISGVILEEGKRLLEMTGALEGWKDILGLTGPTAEEAAKQMENADNQILKGLREKIAMQDAYNQLVLGMKGGDFERAHIELLKQETEEIQKQIVLQTAQVQAQADGGYGWRNMVSMLSPTLGGVLSAAGQGPAKEMMGAQVEANKLAQAMKPLVDRLQEIRDEVQKGAWKIFRDDVDAAAAAAKADITDMQGDLKGWNDEANKSWQAWMKTNDEIDKAIAKMPELELPEEAGRRGQFDKLNGPISSVAPPPGAPLLADQAELLKVTDDQNESWKKAGEILASIETPEQKYSAGLQMLDELEAEGRITAEQFAAAHQKLQEELAESTNKLEMLLRKTGDASAGFQAFLLQLNKSSNQGGAFTFDILNKSLQGFEDQTAQALTGGKTSWMKYFADLDQMALKFMLNKGIAQLMQVGGIANLLGGSTNPTAGSTLGPTQSSIPLPPGVFGSLPGVINGAGGAGATTLTAAGTQLTSAATMQISAAAELQAAASVLSSGSIGSSGAGAAVSAASLYPGFASGTDDAPGGMSWVGENGPELVDLPAGSSVTPMSSVRAGGSTHNWFIDARGNEDVGDRIQRALTHAMPIVEQRAINAVSEIQRRTPH